MAITINGSGTITGVSAGGLPDGCVTADDIASLPSGSVLQVVTSNTDTEVTTTSTTFSDTGLSATITPSSTSSKILILTRQSTWIERSGGESAQGWVNLLRDSTQINQTFITAECGLNNESDRAVTNVVSECYLDSPNTTSAVTYKTQQKTAFTTASPQIATQKGGTLYFSTITLMEIAG